MASLAAGPGEANAAGLRRPLQEPTAEVPGGPLDEAQARWMRARASWRLFISPILVGGCEVVRTRKELSSKARKRFRTCGDNAKPWALRMENP